MGFGAELAKAVAKDRMRQRNYNRKFDARLKKRFAKKPKTNADKKRLAGKKPKLDYQ